MSKTENQMMREFDKLSSKPERRRQLISDGIFEYIKRADWSHLALKSNASDHEKRFRNHLYCPRGGDEKSWNLLQKIGAVPDMGTIQKRNACFDEVFCALMEVEEGIYALIDNYVDEICEIEKSLAN